MRASIPPRAPLPRARRIIDVRPACKRVAERPCRSIRSRFSKGRGAGTGRGRGINVFENGEGIRELKWNGEENCVYVDTGGVKPRGARGYARLTDNGLLPCRAHLPRGHLRFLRRVACHLGVAGDKILPLARLTYPVPGGHAPLPLSLLVYRDRYFFFSLSLFSLSSPRYYTYSPFLRRCRRWW